MAEQPIEVVVQIGGDDVPAGRLWSHRRNVESATFAYYDAYLTRPGAYELDPALPLVEGRATQRPPEAGQLQTPTDRPTASAENRPV